MRKKYAVSFYMIVITSYWYKNIFWYNYLYLHKFHSNASTQANVAQQLPRIVPNTLQKLLKPFNEKTLQTHKINH